MRRLFLITLLALSAINIFAQASVESKIDSIQILIGEQTDLTLSVRAKKNSKVIMPNYEPLDTLIRGIEVVETSKIDTTLEDDDFVKLTRRYRLTSFDEDMYYIPGLKVSVDGKEFKTENLALKVLTLEVDTLHPENFYPPKDVQDNPFSWSEWLPLFLLSILTVLLIVGIYYLWTRLKQNKPIVVRVLKIKRELPHQKAIREIERIKSEKMTLQEDQKAYYTLLTDTLRKYIEERFGFNAMEMTSSEIIEHLSSHEDKTMISELRELFQTSDLVKFAKHSALINENDRNLISAVEFINNTKQEDQPTEEKIVPEISSKDRRKVNARRTLKVTLIVLPLIVIALLALIIYRVYALIM
ncbi:MAG: hypothetical protein LUC37_00510 [Prevotella sp.]|nr:hypothetical protein [Prevotella sp.]